jgi:hypothetical protein
VLAPWWQFGKGTVPGFYLVARVFYLIDLAPFSEILPIQAFYLVHLLINHNKISGSAFALTTPVIIIL